MKEGNLDLSVLGNLLVLSGCLLALGVWLLWPGAQRRLLPPARRRFVPWTGAEVLGAVFLTLIFWPLAVRQVVSFLDRPSPALRIGLLGVSPDLPFPANLPWPALTQLAETSRERSDRISLWVTVLACPFQVASILILFRTVSGTRAYQLGLTPHRWPRNVLAGLLTWFTTAPFVLLLNVALEIGFRSWTHAPPETHPITRLGHHPLTVSRSILIVLAAAVVAPVVEELLFRGVLQPWLARRPGRPVLALVGALGVAVLLRLGGLLQGWPTSGVQGVVAQLAPVLFVLLMMAVYFLLPPLRRSAPAGAVYATALLFGASHSFVWPTPVPLFVLGLALGLLAYRTQSLVGSMTCHSLFNGIACLLLLLGQGQPDQRPNGNDATSAGPRPASVSTSSGVPGSWLPRRR